MINDVEQGLLISVKVIPNASKNEIIKSADTLKLRITSQPIEGKANKAVIEFLSKQLKVPKSYFEIVKGQASKDKKILIKISDKEKKDSVKNFLKYL